MSNKGRHQELVILNQRKSFSAETSSLIATLDGFTLAKVNQLAATAFGNYWANVTSHRQPPRRPKDHMLI